MADMTLLSYALGVALIAAAVIGIVRVLATPPSGRTYGASIYDDDL